MATFTNKISKCRKENVKVIREIENGGGWGSG